MKLELGPAEGDLDDSEDDAKDGDEVVFLTEAPQQDSQRKVMSRDKSEKIRGMLKSITSEIKVGPNSNRELVFSNCEVEQIQSRKSFDKFSHSKALFNFNK